VNGSPFLASIQGGARAPYARRVTVDEVLEVLAATPGVRRVPVDAPLTAGMLVAGIEITATRPAPERTLRKLWRDRRGGGATPLLLLADDPARPGCVSALGTIDVSGPLRSVEATALSDIVRRLAGRPRLEAVRELTAELDRLDLGGVPGLKLRDLLTMHTLDVRLRNDPLRWTRAREVTKSIQRGAEWRTVLTGLGYHIERRPQRGFLARYEGRPVAVIHAVRDPAEFSRLDSEGRPPEGLLLNDCQADGAEFGLLASGSRLRLFEADPSQGSAVSRYLDIDAGALQAADLPFLALVGPDYLDAGEFEALVAEAQSFGAGLRQRLDNTIRQTVLPTLGRALGRWERHQGRDLTEDATREELERAALTLVFRVLFILYAESAGYLPMDNRSYRHASLTSLVEEAADTTDRLGVQSTSLWDRFFLLVKAMRTSNPAWGVPAYNGALFAAHGFDGAATLEEATFADPDFATMLVGLGRDPDTGSGIDYSTLEISHLGHIYESLLSLRLSLADVPLIYNSATDTYESAADDQTPDVIAGDLLWQTNEGGRKGGGVYYTRTELVRHLVRGSVAPAFHAHLTEIGQIAATDPAAAAERLFDFAALDPACGSAHFLVVVVNELADMVVRFLGEIPLPDVRSALERLRSGASQGAVIEDVALIRRLLLKRCVFGVDVSPMGAEVAKLSLWLASFVPGLSLAYLDRNVVVGNSLIGVARPEALRAGHPEHPALWDDALAAALTTGARAAARVAEGDDRTPDEYEESKEANAQLREAVSGLQRLFDLWTAEPLGVTGARATVELRGLAIIDGATEGPVDAAEEQRERHRFLHWPLAFPHVFTRPNPGFDAVVGNPPWEEVTVESLAFYGLFRPGLRSLPQEPRASAITELVAERPDLPGRLAAAQERSAEQRRYFSAGEYESMPGDPDLYKFFCQRYRHVLRDGGVLGVVLPRSAFITDGSGSFRRWLFEETTCRRCDFLLNTGRWAFDSEPRYTVALVAAERSAPSQDHKPTVAGTAANLDEWKRQADSPGHRLPLHAFGPDYTVPLLRSQSEADLLAKLRIGHAFPFGAGGRWRCFPVRELDETMDRRLWQEATSGRPLWKGESFDQYDPHGAEARICPDNAAVRKKVEKPRPGAKSVVASELALTVRRQAVLDEIDRTRLAFRDVSRATDSRTVRACFVPAGVFLTNKAPYLAFATGGDIARAACLGIMNSLTFDWQARRFVEINLNFFILEGLVVPDLSDESMAVIAGAAARLSCVDQRFTDLAASFDIEPGPLADDERERLRIEIDAQVAHSWGLTDDDLDVLLADFTVDAVPTSYRLALRERLQEL
jgi:hypothetical protein